MLRRMVFGAALIGAAILVPVSSANALPPGGGNGTQNSLTYYSDAQHTQVVGGQGYDCQGNPWHWGTTSPYSVFAISSCLPS
ncbi:hypothetical protein ABIA35_001365 [Catenulispora sp. MAP12-49]|jgi:hypothetical protein|uniref:DUF6289 family protein n=1 Tax=Catenulispora sp. MAP12-49 TaxID=3156302 RepID=UPI003515AB30